MPGISGKLGILVQDKNGTILRCTEEPLHSFNDAFSVLIASLLTSKWQDYKDIANASRTLLHMYDGSLALAIAGDDTKGIILGSLDTAFDHAQYAIATKIAHGSTTGLIQYGVEIATNPAWNGSTKWTFNKYRTFNNVSGGAIVVKEIALYTKEMANASTVMLHREVPAPISVPDSGALKVTCSYEILS
jgi:hypothetical protein